MFHPFRMARAGLVFGLAACTSQAGGVTEAVDDPAAGADACGAAAMQEFAGQRVDALNDVDLPEGTRVLFPGMAATMDFRPDRLNFEIDGSDQITRVYCG
jgi:hypothetical protein